MVARGSAWGASSVQLLAAGSYRSASKRGASKLSAPLPPIVMIAPSGVSTLLALRRVCGSEARKLHPAPRFVVSSTSVVLDWSPAITITRLEPSGPEGRSTAPP